MGLAKNSNLGVEDGLKASTNISADAVEALKHLQCLDLFYVPSVLDFNIAEVGLGLFWRQEAAAEVSATSKEVNTAALQDARGAWDD